MNVSLIVCLIESAVNADMDIPLYRTFSESNVESDDNTGTEATLTMPMHDADELVHIWISACRRRPVRCWTVARLSTDLPIHWLIEEVCVSVASLLNIPCRQTFSFIVSYSEPFRAEVEHTDSLADRRVCVFAASLLNILKKWYHS